MQFVFDIDGTICFKGKPLSRAMIQALETCITMGHEVIFASARPIRDLLPVLPSHMHHYPMIGGNGAMVAKHGSTLKIATFSDEIVHQLRQLIQDYELTYLIDSRWNYAYTGSKEHPIYRNLDPLKLANNVDINHLSEWIKIILFPNKHEKQILLALQKLPVQLYQHALEEIIDISPPGINKWHALQSYGIHNEEYIAFGNDANDIQMLQHAKDSVCVGDYFELQAISTMHVESDEQQIIEKIMTLSKKYA